MVKKLLLIVALLSQLIFAVNDEAILSKRPELSFQTMIFLNHPKSKFLMTMFINISSNPLFSDYSLKDRFVYIPEEKKQFILLIRFMSFQLEQH